MRLKQIVRKALRNLIHVGNPVWMSKNAKSVRFFDMIQNPDAGGIGKSLDARRNLQRLCKRVHLLLILGNRQNRRTNAVDRPRGRIGAPAPELIRGFQQAVDAVVSAEIYNVDIIAGQMDLLTGIKMDIKSQPLIKFHQLKRRIKLPVIGQRHEIVAESAVVRRHDIRMLPAVGHGGVHVHVPHIRIAAVKILSDGIDSKLNDPHVVL